MRLKELYHVFFYPPPRETLIHFYVSSPHFHSYLTISLQVYSGTFSQTLKARWWCVNKQAKGKYEELITEMLCVPLVI